MESKNKTVLMAIIDSVLENTVWVNKSGENISLKDAIAKNTTGRIENLDRNDLLGAYTSFQIKRQSFAENTRDMSNTDLANKIKSFIFDETRDQMLMVERELNVKGNEKIRKTA